MSWFPPELPKTLTSMAYQSLHRKRTLIAFKRTHDKQGYVVVYRFEDPWGRDLEEARRAHEQGLEFQWSAFSS